MNGLKKQYSEKVDFETIKIDDYKTYNYYQKKYNFLATPMVMVIDRSGNVVFKETGVVDKASYADKMKAALEQVAK